MSKKIITVLFAALVLAFGITACQPKDSSDDTANAADNSTATTDANGSDDADTTADSSDDAGSAE